MRCRPRWRSTADGNGDHAVRQGAAVGETGAPGTPRRRHRRAGPFPRRPSTPRRRPRPGRRPRSRRTAAEWHAKRRRSRRGRARLRRVQLRCPGRAPPRLRHRLRARTRRRLPSSLCGSGRPRQSLRPGHAGDKRTSAAAPRRQGTRGMRHRRGRTEPALAPGRGPRSHRGLAFCATSSPAAEGSATRSEVMRVSLPEALPQMSERTGSYGLSPSRAPKLPAHRARCPHMGRRRLAALAALVIALAVPAAAAGRGCPVRRLEFLLPSLALPYDPASPDDCIAGRVQCVDKTIRGDDAPFRRPGVGVRHAAIFSLTYLRVTEEYRRTIEGRILRRHPVRQLRFPVFARYYFQAFDAWSSTWPR